MDRDARDRSVDRGDSGRYAATTRCKETGNGYPAGGLWARPEAQMGEDLPVHLGLLNEGDEMHSSHAARAELGFCLMRPLGEPRPLRLACPP